MAIKIYCDRCNKEITSNLHTLHIDMSRENSLVETTYTDVVELCEKCLKGVISYLHIIED